MIFQKVFIIILSFLIVLSSVRTSNSERNEKRIRPKKISQDLKEHIEQISKATNSKPQRVKPELKQLINPKATVKENENNNLQNLINDLKQKPNKDIVLNQSTYILKKEGVEVTNPSRKQEKRETSAAEENFKRESEYYLSKPANLTHYPRYGTPRVNNHVMPGMINVPNNTGATSFHDPLNSGRVPQPVNLPNVWAPSLGFQISPNHPSNSKPTIGTTTTSSYTTKTTTEISVFIRNATLKDKTEGKILIPETNHNPNRVPTLDDDKKPLPTNEDGVGGDLCLHCLCSSNMLNVYCSGKYNKSIRTLQKNQMPNRIENLVLRDYDVLEVDPQVFSSSNNLKDITFDNITELHLKKESLYFVSKSRKNMKVIIRFKNCHLKQLPTDAITQNVDGRHQNRNFFSGETRRYLSVEFINCTIGNMQVNSMHRAILYNFYMAKTKIFKISTRAIDLDVKTLAKFEGNDMPSLPTEAICLHSGTVVFLSNRIHSLYNRSIIVEAKSKVSFIGNMFEELHAESLAGIEASTNIYGPSIVFTNNILKRIGSKSFFFGGPFTASSQTLLNNTFYTMCSCHIEKEFESFTGTTMHKSPSLKIVFRSSYCIENVSAAFILVDDFLSQECSPFPVVTVSAVSVAGFLFIIAVTVCVVCSLRVQQVKEEANMLGECTSQSFSTLSRNYTDTLGQHCNETVPPSPFAVVPWGLAFPEVKTYQQNQVQEFTEQTESISGSTRDSLMAHRSDPMARHPDRASCPFN